MYRFFWISTICFIFSDSAISANAEQNKTLIILPCLDNLGTPIFSAKLFTKPGNKYRSYLLPEQVSLDLDVPTGTVAGMTLVYPREVAFDQLIAEIDKSNRKYRKGGFHEFGLAIWRNNEAKYAIQVRAPDTSSKDLYGPTMVVISLEK